LHWRCFFVLFCFVLFLGKRVYELVTFALTNPAFVCIKLNDKSRGAPIQLVHVSELKIRRGRNGVGRREKSGRKCREEGENEMLGVGRDGMRG